MWIHVVSLNRLDNDWAIRHVIECCLVQESVFVFRGKARPVCELGLIWSSSVIKGMGLTFEHGRSSARAWWYFSRLLIAD